MKEIESNKKAWNLLAKDHYDNFKKVLENEETNLSQIVINEIGNIKGKTLIHLQCNTGADTISLARLGAVVTGVDLAPDNVYYARQLASDFSINDAKFFECDIMQLKDVHHEKYDIVFTSEGAIGWLPDLRKWGQTIRALLKDDGFFYINEIHPYFLTLDEDKLKDNEIYIKYPYFENNAEANDTIGGYASNPKEATNYFWMYKVSDIINALSEAGLQIEFFNEFDTLCYDLGKMERISKGIYRYPHLKGKFPFHFSIKATVRKK